jgi:predicted HicB family RNase H-like nuclease
MAGATKTITLRVPPEEHAAWQAAAAADQRTLSSWIRKQCSVVAPPVAPTAPKPRRKRKVR